jgi:hypothetical protein
VWSESHVSRIRGPLQLPTRCLVRGAARRHRWSSRYRLDDLVFCSCLNYLIQATALRLSISSTNSRPSPNSPVRPLTAVNSNSSNSSNSAVIVNCDCRLSTAIVDRHMGTPYGPEGGGLGRNDTGARPRGRVRRGQASKCGGQWMRYR